MPEYMILKQEGADWLPSQIVSVPTAADLLEAVKQGFREPGRYAITRWDNRREFDMQVQVQATEVTVP